MFETLGRLYPDYFNLILKRSQTHFRMHKKRRESIDDTRERMGLAIQFNLKDKREYETRRRAYLEKSSGGHLSQSLSPTANQDVKKDNFRKFLDGS